MNKIQSIIEFAWENREALQESEAKEAVRAVIEKLDKGELRVASSNGHGEWTVHEWVKKAVVMYFPIQQMKTMEAGPMEFHDKMELKRNYAALGVRVVPHAVARYGAYLAPGVIMMPSYVNIGAYVDSGTMVDTWATVGSCAQIGAFIGSRAIVVEGVRVGKEAVLGANVVLTKTTRIIDVSGPEPVSFSGEIPERSVVIPGVVNKSFPAGEFGVPCALIIGKRKASTDLKTSLNDALREFNVSA